MTFEIILPSLDHSQWVSGIMLSVFSFFFGTISALFIWHRDSDSDLITGLVLGFFALLMLFGVLNIFEIITLVFV